MLSSLNTYDLTILFWENADAPLSQIANAHPRDDIRRMLIVLGPEGGFEPAEISDFRSLKVPIASLGPRILRADTAALAACTLAQFLWGDLDSKGQ